MELKGISFTHKHATTPILRDISFRAERGELLTVLGPNGSGKTTLFKCIAGLWKPGGGNILFRGADLTTLSHEQRSRLIAVVPQEHEPPFPYSVSEVVLMGRVSHVGMFSTPAGKDYEKAAEAMAIVGISDIAQRPYTKISGGERQLALIARALSQETPVLLLDEPTSHLDFRNQALVLKKVREIALERSLIVLMTLHDPNLTALFSDKVVMVNNGALFCKGASHQVITGDNLKKVYGIDVSVLDWNGTRIVTPRIE